MVLMDVILIFYRTILVYNIYNTLILLSRRVKTIIYLYIRMVQVAFKKEKKKQFEMYWICSACYLGGHLNASLHFHDFMLCEMGGLNLEQHTCFPPRLDSRTSNFTPHGMVELRLNFQILIWRTSRTEATFFPIRF